MGYHVILSAKFVAKPEWVPFVEFVIECDVFDKHGRVKWSSEDVTATLATKPEWRELLKVWDALQRGGGQP